MSAQSELAKKPDFLHSKTISNSSSTTEDTDPVVIVGNGPVGMRAISELLSRLPKVPIVVYGEEAHPPYDRVRLSSWLSGELSLDGFVKPFRRPFGSKVDERYGIRITSINKKENTVSDSAGRTCKYSTLILATGSHAYIPDISGIEAEGVFSLRSLDDATKLMARRIRSRHTVVIGGGLLGLEAARGMQPGNNRVTVIEHSDRIMASQLDLESASVLKTNVEALGIKVLTGGGIKSIQGSPRVEGVLLQSGVYLECDTVVFATGIRPNIELAQSSGLSYGRGIKVNDQMQTSHANIYAIGECAEHRETVYGLVAPGFEQAGVAANAIAGKASNYEGSMAASRLKVVGTQVFSVGPMGHTANPLTGKSDIYRDEKNGTYRKILIKRNRLIGAIGIGEWPQSVRLQSGIAKAEFIYPWQRLRFKYKGDIWLEDDGNQVARWPEQTIVCQCMGVSRGKLSDAIAAGSQNIESLGKACGAGTVCGSCKPMLSGLLGKVVRPQAIKGIRPLLAFTFIATLLSIAFLIAPALPYSTSVQPENFFEKTLDWHWDSLWRERLNKQITGFTILGAAIVASLLSFRKRIKRLHSAGNFSSWRIAHLGISVIALCALLLHSGFRMGHGLNFALMSLFVALAVLGCISALVLGLEHKLPASFAGAVKRHSTRMHIYLLWPVPALLGWHILKGYWY